MEFDKKGLNDQLKKFYKIIEKEVNQRLVILNDYAFEIGVISGVSSSRKNKKNNPILTNAYLLSIQENGSPIHNIPSRPILKYICQYWINELSNYYLGKIFDGVVNNNWSRNNIERTLKIAAKEIQNWGRDLAMRRWKGHFIDNAISTQRAKGIYKTVKGKRKLVTPVNHPLVDTGQMIRSIVVILINNKTGKIIK